MDFIIDTVGDDELQVKTELLDENDKYFIEMDGNGRTTHQQFLKIIEFMERHGDISFHRGDLQPRIENDLLWLKLTATLNSIAGGVRKTPLKWRKVWSDLKNNTRKKYHKLKQSGKLGEVGVNKKYLNPTEMRVLAVLDPRINDQLGSLKKDVWSDLKNNTRKKYYRLKQNGKLGDVGLKRKYISATETRVLALLNDAGIQLPSAKRDELPQPNNDNNENTGEMELIFVPVENEETSMDPTTSEPEYLEDIKEDVPSTSSSPSPESFTAQTPPPQTPEPQTRSPQTSPTQHRKQRESRRQSFAVDQGDLLEKMRYRYHEQKMQRLRMEEARETRRHELEMQRLRLESQRIEEARTYNQVLHQLLSVVHSLVDKIGQQQRTS